MQNKKSSLWREGLVINLVSNAVCFVVGVVVAYLKHEGSEWVSPLLFGVMAWLLSMGIWFIARVLRTIPTRQRITDRNLPTILRGWFDDIGLKVQSKKDDLTDFTFIVTTDGNWVISIMRLKESPEYLTFTGYYKGEVQNFSHFTDKEKIEARLAIRLELSRSVMGYTSQDILEGFTLFRRIPISPQLSIEEVSRTLWEVEAALASVFITGAVLLNKKNNENLLLSGKANEE
jgi:hypothetical protein